jgi:hypothetical protein
LTTLESFLAAAAAAAIAVRSLLSKQSKNLTAELLGKARKEEEENSCGFCPIFTTSYEREREGDVANS